MSTQNAEEVAFYSDGLRIDAQFTNGAGSELRKPTIVCIHGYSGRKSIYMPAYVRELSAAGYNTLDFFHRGFGNSDGYRCLCKPWDQVIDILSALIYVRSRADVDPARVALYGTSFGGSTVMVAAAKDEEVKCAVSVGSAANVDRSFRSKRTYSQLLDWEEQLKQDRIERVLKGKSRYVPYGELIPSGRAEADSLTTMYKISEGYPEGYPMASYDYSVDFFPENYVGAISPRPVLFIHGEKDTMVPVTEAEHFYAAANEPKQLIVLRDANHVDVYEPRNPATFKVVIGHMIEFFDKNLK
jgi:uncharacterized protein